MDTAEATADLADELAALRRRAYAPDADIHRDPEALARLHELEQRRRDLEALRRTDVAGESDDAPGSRADESGAVDSEAVTVPEATDPPQTAERPASPAPAAMVERERVRPWWRRWRIWLSAGIGAAAGAGIVVTAVWMAGQPDLTLHPVEPDARPGPVDYLEYLELDEDTLVAYEPFEKLTPWVGTTATGHTCLLLLISNQVGNMDCAPPVVDPTLCLPGWGFGWPVEAGDLPDGSYVRFVARNDAVDVWVVRGRDDSATEFLDLIS